MPAARVILHVARVLALMAAAFTAAPARAQENAAPLWRQAFTAAGFGGGARYLTDEEMEFVSDLGFPPSIEERARLDAIMTKSAPVRQQFEAAARVRRSDWELDTSLGFELTLPHLANLRSAARMLRVQAMWELDGGDSGAATGTLQALGNMGMQVGQDDILVSSLVGTAVGSMFVEGAQFAIESGAIDQKAAESFLEGMGPLKGPDPFGYSKAIAGEWDFMSASLSRAKDDRGLADLLQLADAPGTPGGAPRMTLEQARREAAGLKPLYDRAARAFSSPDPNAAMEELRRIDQGAQGGKFGELAKVLFPSLMQAYQAKLRVQQDIALLVAKLLALAEGKEKPQDLRNAALDLARASAGARSVGEEVQESIELLRIAPAALDDDRRRQAEDVLARSDRAVFLPLASAVACTRCDFAVLRHPQPTLDVRLLGGVRGAVRIALAQGLRQARLRADPAPAVAAAVTAYRVAGLLAKDPSLGRSAVAHCIWNEATDALRGAIAVGPIPADRIDEVERAISAMPAGDPFGFRKAVELDAARLATPARGVRLDWMKEAVDARTQILRQRGPSSVFARVAFESISRRERMPEAEDGVLVRMSDLYPGDAVAGLRRAVEEQEARRNRGEDADVPFDLPLEQQKSLFRRSDPVRNLQFIDAGTLMSTAAADYAKAFEAVKAARAPRPPVSE